MDLTDRIDALIAERHLLQHPFYVKWRDGTLPTEAIQDYARQYYAFESTFPRLLSSIHARCARPEIRQALLDNLWDEEHGDVNHAELWLRFAEGMGVSREEVREASHNDGTRRLLDTYWRLTTDAELAAGIAALYAYEQQVPEVAAEKIRGLVERYGIEDPRTLAFFTVHSTLDVEHSGAERSMITSLAAEAGEDAVVDATRETLDAWWGFLDAVDRPAAIPA
ncbi:MAG: CADD family putative folate metabolism protein [Candidatus Limnocylindria bacterium]